HREIGGVNFRKLHLLADFRHPCPCVENVRHSVTVQTAEIFRAQKLLIPHFNGIAEVRRQHNQKRIELLQELTDVRVSLLPECAELENQHRNAFPVRRQQIQKRVAKQKCIQKRRISLPRPRSVAWMRGKHLHCDFLRGFEGVFQRGRRGTEQALPILL